MFTSLKRRCFSAPSTALLRYLYIRTSSIPNPAATAVNQAIPIALMRGDILVGRFRGRDCVVCFEYRGGALSLAVFDRINVLAEEPEVRLKQIVYRAHTNTNTKKMKQQAEDNTPRK